jgi:hypothetical protein
MDRELTQNLLNKKIEVDKKNTYAMCMHVVILGNYVCTVL